MRRFSFIIEILVVVSIHFTNRSVYFQTDLGNIETDITRSNTVYFRLSKYTIFNILYGHKYEVGLPYRMKYLAYITKHGFHFYEKRNG